MGESGSLSFVHTLRRRALARAVADVMERLGYAADPRGDLDVALIPGRGWTAIVCSDPELLCERPEGESKPAIAFLAEAVGRSAFQISVHDGDSVTLLEATPKGRVVASGGEGQTASAFCHAEPIREEHLFSPRFYAIPVKKLRAMKETISHYGLLAKLSPRTPPFALLRGDVLDDERLVPKRTLRLSFATTVKRSSRPPRPFRWWKGIYNFPDGEPTNDDGVYAFSGDPMGTVSEVKQVLARHFGPLLGTTADVNGVPVELELLPRGAKTVAQIDVRVIATDEGMPTAIALRLAALAAEKGWTVVDWN
jgi:hypothetical protein